MTLPSGLAIETNVSMKTFTSWLVGGNAEFLARPRTIIELREALAWARLKRQPVTLLSGGTNCLVSDDGVAGLTIVLRNFSGSQQREVSVESTGERRLEIECLAGTSKSELLKIFLKHRLEPALFLAGIPGDVGGGIAMNAGIGEMMTPREFVEITDWVEVLKWENESKVTRLVSGEPSHEQITELARQFQIERFSKSQLQWSYRHCVGWQPGVIVNVGLSWRIEPMSDLLAQVKKANQVRLSKQPLDMPSCGSVFINPPSHTGHKSGQLIEGAALKGLKIGNAQVSSKHANFIVNLGEATADNIHELISKVQAVVLEKFGVSIKTEVVYIGRWPHRAN